MRYALLVPIVMALFVGASSVRADLQLVPVDAVNPPADFSKTFAISIKKSTDLRTITISYASRPEQKITSTYADGTKVERYADGVLEGSQILVANEDGRNILTAPLRFRKERDGRTSASITLQKGLANRTRVRLFIPFRPNGFCYEIHFNKVK